MEENLSIVLIAHDEEDVIGAMIDGLLENYNKEILELLVVDDNSSDKTAQIIETRSNLNHK